MPDDLHPALREGLERAGIEALWVAPGRGARGRAARPHDRHDRHRERQVAGVQPARAGHARARRGARALYLYPTKALAQDQARALARLGGRFLRHAIYDGDTPREERRAIRQRSNLILTNPDMLHVGVLPNHRQWGDVLANLAWVVVDEAHVYRGVFGSHVANVLRRLRRLARAYGTEPRFMLTSATIANPAELAERLTGVDFELVGPRRRAARRAPGRDVEPAAGGREARPARVRRRRRRGCWPRSWSARCARSASSSRAAAWS